MLKFYVRKETSRMRMGINKNDLDGCERVVFKCMIKIWSYLSM